MKNVRKNLYISERLDKDLISYINQPQFLKDFSNEVRMLMRDGIKFRSGVTTTSSIATTTPIQRVVTPEFEHKKVKLSTEEVSSMLDRL